MSTHLNRVFLWCVPRTLSTALTKCLSSIEGMQVVNEPYVCASVNGPERNEENFKETERALKDFIQKKIELNRAAPPNGGYEDSVCTYSWIRDELLAEAPYSSKKYLFCKAMAYCLNGKYDLLPAGFKHSFIIRHPQKVFSSWKLMLSSVLKDVPGYRVDLRSGPSLYFPDKYGFKELLELFEYVQNKLGQEPVVIDVDDLICDPAGILSSYCQKMGLPYNPELLTWQEGPETTNTWIMSKSDLNSNQNNGYYDTAFQSSRFGEPTPIPDFDSLDADVQTCVTASIEYYEKLYERRIRSLPVSPIVGATNV